MVPIRYWRAALTWFTISYDGRWLREYPIPVTQNSAHPRGWLCSNRSHEISDSTDKLSGVGFNAGWCAGERDRARTTAKRRASGAIAMKSRGVSIAAIAAEMGVHRNSVSNWLKSN